jgi:triosephosphate isomerase
MRKQIVAGNWKMNKDLGEGIALASEVNSLVENDPTQAIVIVAPPFIHLDAVSRVLTVVKLSAQNCSSEPAGAFTGEVSAEMIRSTGASYVIIGHSERRNYFGEDDLLLNKKIRLALSHGLIPIFCCGEQLAQRQGGIHMKIVASQLEQALFGLQPEEFSKMVIAYEPVWAIGTGVNATPEQAQEMHAFIRNQIAGRFGQQMAADTTIMYGGSCKPSNAGELFNNPDVDGGLIGGASLNAGDFMAIVRAARQ